MLAAGALSGGGDVTTEEDMAGSTGTGKWLRERYSYDRYGRLHYKEDANGNRTSYRYAEGHPRKLSPANMYPETETSPEGYEYYYHYDQAGRKTKVESEGTTMEFSYNGLHHVNHVTDGEGNVTHEEYDNLGSLIRHYNHRQWMKSRNGGGYTYEYDYLDRLIKVKDPLGREKHSYDKAGRLIRKEESESGREERISHPDNSTTRYGYDEAGNLTFLRLPEGGIIHIAYDAADRPVCMLEQDKKNGICRGMNYLYDDVCAMPWEQLYGREDYEKELNQKLMECNTLKDYHGDEFLGMLSKEQPSTVRYYSGKKALGIYDAYVQIYEVERVWKPGAEEKIEAGKEGADYYTHRYRYDFRGSLLSLKDTLGNWTGYDYNQAGNLIKLTAPDGSEMIFVYDEQGRLLSKTNGEQEREYLLAYDKLDRVMAESDGEGNTTSYTYHSTGETSRVTGADGKTDWQTSYDIWGRPDSVIDGNGNKTTYQKDSWGRVTRVTYPDGGEEHYAYDYAGNIIRARDAVGNETEFCYNGDSRLERIKKADGSRRYFGYDREGRCIYRKDENENVISLSYNMDGNPVASTGRSKAAKADEEPEIRSVYIYDEQGFLVQASEGGSVYQYERDTEGNTLKKSASGRTLYQAAYDECGRLKMLDGTYYRYDKAGRLQQIRSDNGISATYHYNKNGMQTEVYCGNGLRTTYEYDSRNQLTLLTAGFGGKVPLLQAAYCYDGNGNRAGKEEQIQKKLGTERILEHTAYSYDKMNRLTGEIRNGGETSYCYDLAGNRTSRIQKGNEETYHYNSRNQLIELTSDNGNIRYSYDLAGNLVEENHAYIIAEDRRIQFAYDSYNRNTKIKGNDFLQQNIYDAEGYRCSLEENGEVTYFAYRSGMLLNELDGEGISTKSYVSGNEYVGLVEQTGKECEARYYVTDEQGSIRNVLNSKGEVESYYQYNAFGESIIQEGDRSRLQYNSQIWDELSGLYYLRARYYCPRTGRFTQEDVIYDDGLNLYAYCNSNPVIYCDPSGFAKNTHVTSKVGMIILIGMIF